MFVSHIFDIYVTVFTQVMQLWELQIWFPLEVCLNQVPLYWFSHNKLHVRVFIRHRRSQNSPAKFCSFPEGALLFHNNSPVTLHCSPATCTTVVKTQLVLMSWLSKWSSTRSLAFFPETMSQVENIRHRTVCPSGENICVQEAAILMQISMKITIPKDSKHAGTTTRAQSYVRFSGNTLYFT